MDQIPLVRIIVFEGEESICSWMAATVPAVGETISLTDMRDFSSERKFYRISLRHWTHTIFDADGKYYDTVELHGVRVPAIDLS